jgi:hypothetical protein
VDLSAPEFVGGLGPLDKDDCAQAVELKVRTAATATTGIIVFIRVPFGVVTDQRNDQTSVPGKMGRPYVQLRTDSPKN